MKVLALALLAALAAVSMAEIRTMLETSQVIPGRFIIKLKDGLESASFIKSASLRRNDGVLAKLSESTDFVYTHALNGFAAALDDSMLRSLDAMQEIDWIEPDQVMTAYGQVQTGAVWGLARSSVRNTLSGSTYNFFYKSPAGTGATVYVIDTGVLTTHTDFGGRASFGYSSITGESNSDLNGHGTHVAGTVAGSAYGVAKLANIVAVKVLNANGSGSNAGVVAGIDWVTRNAPTSRAVINMSLGGGASAATDTAVANARARGITVVVAAGNSNANACNYSPARATAAITVAASDVNDRSASFTNFGSCTQTYAPGVSVRSAWIGSNTATNSISGTSMASPHVAGLAAYLIREYSLTTPTQVENKISEYYSTNRLTSVPSNTPNVLIYNGGNGVNIEEDIVH